MLADTFKLLSGRLLSISSLAEGRASSSHLARADERMEKKASLIQIMACEGTRVAPLCEESDCVGETLA